MNDKQFMTIFLGVMGVLTITFFVIFFIAQIIVPDKKAFLSGTIIWAIKKITKKVIVSTPITPKKIVINCLSFIKYFSFF